LFGGINVILTLVVLVQAIRCGVDLYIRKREERLPATGNRINTVLFWSGLIVLLGFVQSFWGASSGLESVIRSGSSDPKLVYALIAELLQVVIYSLSVFTVSVMIWFVFRSRHTKLLSAAPGNA